MTGPLKKVECDPACGFMVRSHDEQEIYRIVKEHAFKSHNMKVSDKELKEKIMNA